MLRVFDMANVNILDGKDDQNSSHRGNFSASEFDCYNYDTANIQLLQSYRIPYRTFISRKTNIPSTYTKPEHSEARGITKFPHVKARET